MDSWSFNFNLNLNLIDPQWSFIQNNVLVLIGSFQTQQGKCASKHSSEKKSIVQCA
jgi:hypothetical protein